jgi:hypothetical protein
MKVNATSSRKAIVKACATGALVRVKRFVEDGHVNGYVCGVGAELFFLCVVSGEIRFDGFQAFRFADVTKVSDPAPHHAFVTKALYLRKCRRPRVPKIDLADMVALLQGVAAAFPLATIHREVVDPDVCQIGKVVRVSRKTVTLREITPDATWKRKLYRYALPEITRVDFGGAYEEALHAVDQAS